MRHDPNGDHLEISTNELVCTLMSRFDCPDSLFTLLGLMIEASVALPSSRQYRMAATLHDVAGMIEQRPAVRDCVDRLRLPPAYSEARNAVNS